MKETKATPSRKKRKKKKKRKQISYSRALDVNNLIKENNQTKIDNGRKPKQTKVKTRTRRI